MLKKHLCTQDTNLADPDGNGNSQTLLAAGKSRADLWALAGITSIEFSVNENNLACTKKGREYTIKKTKSNGDMG